MEIIRLVEGSSLSARRTLAEPELSPRELAWLRTDTHGAFISESGVYRILKAFDLVTSPAYIVLSAKDRFGHPASHPAGPSGRPGSRPQMWHDAGQTRAAGHTNRRRANPDQVRLRDGPGCAQQGHRISPMTSPSFRISSP